MANLGEHLDWLGAKTQDLVAYMQAEGGFECAPETEKRLEGYVSSAALPYGALARYHRVNDPEE